MFDLKSSVNLLAAIKPGHAFKLTCDLQDETFHGEKYEQGKSISKPQFACYISYSVI